MSLYDYERPKWRSVVNVSSGVELLQTPNISYPKTTPPYIIRLGEIERNLVSVDMDLETILKDI